MATRDLSAFFDDGALDYPGIKSKAHPEGKTYRVPSPDVKTGLYLSDLADTGQFAALGGQVTDRDMEKLKLDDDGERGLYQTVLGCVAECGAVKDERCGSTFDEMLVDGVEWAMMQNVARDAFLCFGVNRDFADAVLAGQGKALAAAAPNRATRRAAAKKAPSTARTPRATAGSSSATAPTATPASTRGRTSTRSSKSTPAPAKPRQAKAG